MPIYQQGDFSPSRLVISTIQKQADKYIGEAFPNGFMATNLPSARFQNNIDEELKEVGFPSRNYIKDVFTNKLKAIEIDLSEYLEDEDGEGDSFVIDGKNYSIETPYPLVGSPFEAYATGDFRFFSLCPVDYNRGGTEYITLVLSTQEDYLNHIIGSL